MTSPATRERLTLRAAAQPALALHIQRPLHGTTDPQPIPVIYVHGSTFGAELSVFHRLDGRSWADAMCAAGFTVVGFDFAGYGASERYPSDGQRAAGRLEDVLPQLERIVAAVRERSGGARVTLLAHSWGATVAAAYAARHPQDMAALALFAPVVLRGGPGQAPEATGPSHYPVTLWAQYRRFVEDVPRGQPQVLSEAHFQAWGEAFLASDPQARASMPPAVSTPAGPQQDVRALWSGLALFDAGRIAAPTLLLRGQWDTVCDADDASRFLAAIASPVKRCATIGRGTHLLHLEAQRALLHDAVNDFLLRQATLFAQ